MDSRCPRGLKDMPDRFCPLAVLRLKAIRNSDKNFSEDEEAKLPGCPWGVNHQLANYCFFKLINDYMPNHKDLSDHEIAHFCGISIEDLRKAEKKALQKLKNTGKLSS